MKKIFHCSDIHLGATSRHIPNLLEEQLKVIDRLADSAVKEQASAIVIAGDLFDSPHVPATVIGSFREMVSRHKQMNFVLVSGTHGHDSYENEKSIFKRALFKSFPENFYLLDTSDNGYIVIDNMAFYSSSQTFKSQPVADNHILIFHGTSNEAQDFINSSSVKRFDYIALGHYHFFNDFVINKSAASYSGTLLAFEWPKGNKGINESTFSEVVFDANRVIVNKRYSSEVKLVRSFITESRHLDEIEPLLTENTWLTLWGKPQFKEEAEKRFRNRVNSFDYQELNIKDMPDMLIAAIEQIVQQQTDENIPWNDVREAALRLLSGEEGKDFLRPDKYISTLTGLE